MKITTKPIEQPTPAFKPFQLIIDIQTEGEAEAIKGFFLSAWLTSAQKSKQEKFHGDLHDVVEAELKKIQG